MTIEDVEMLEQARIAAMITGNVAAFNRLFADDMRWAHGSGQIDTKASMIAQFSEGSMRCFAIERSETETRLFGNVAIVTGIVKMDAMAGGVRKDVHSRYSGVWSNHLGTPQLINWQAAKHG